MTISQAFFVILGVLAAVVLLCCAVIWLEKRMPSRQYDERQQVARGNGYRATCWMGFAWCFAAIILLLRQMRGGPVLLEGYLLVFFGAALQVLVFYSYCILTNSALPFSQEPLFSAFLMACLASSQCGRLRFALKVEKGMPFIGEGSVKWVYLTVAVLFYALALVYLIIGLRKKKEEE